ncbi:MULTISPECIES: hypothetical protein [Myxococcus]|uniref:hypothetical protein n=1 Tax=Myxococcus TaxID=32 RepID=UPI0011414063|nr:MULTISPECIES: hypothetical protein [Myxococcus]NOK06319.1 hypothetical protein [Myxococcus xanthus]
MHRRVLLGLDFVLDAGRLFAPSTRVRISLPDDTGGYPVHEYNGLPRSSIAEEKHYKARRSYLRWSPKTLRGARQSTSRMSCVS